MEPINFHMPGYAVNEYKLVLAPPPELREKISKLKQEFAEKYKIRISRYSSAYVGLVNFLALGMMEEKLVHRLQSIALGVAPFKVEVKDYGSFPTHSIYFQITSRLPVQSLVKHLKEAQRLMRLNAENKPHFLDEPHINLAMKLKPWQYEQGWLEYSNRQFTGRFIADGMLLLKRPSGEKGAFQIARRFEFMNLPVSTKQGSLWEKS